MKRLKQELSPFRDENMSDKKYVRDMWSQNTCNSDFHEATSMAEIRREPEQVHSYLKTLDEGQYSSDAKTLRDVNSGTIAKDD